MNLTQNDHEPLNKDTITLLFRDPFNNTNEIEININQTIKDLKQKV